MNHLLKRVSSEPSRQRAAYSDPTLPVHEDVVEAVSSFIIGLTR